MEGTSVTDDAPGRSAPPDRSALRARRRLDLLLFASVFLLAGWFYNGYG